MNAIINFFRRIWMRLGLALGLTRRDVAVLLQPLGLTASSISENSAAGTVVGTITNTRGGSTLSITDTAGTRFDLSGGQIVAGVTATDYETATSHNITVRETLAGAANSPRDTVIPISVLDVLEGLATPTLALSSAAGAAPLELSLSTTDYVVGSYGQLQIATDAAFTSIAQDIVFFIDGDSWARLDQDIGLVTPSGTYYARVRILRDNPTGATSVTDGLGNTFNADASSWSSAVTDTIGAGAAELTSTNGTGKNQYVAVSGTPGLTYTGTGGVSAYQPVRATIQAQSALVQIEVTINAVNAASEFSIGFDDGTSNFAGFVSPGVSNSAGIAVNFWHNQTIEVFWASASRLVFVNTAGSVAVGDVFTIRIDTTSHTLDIWRTRSGTTTKLGAQATGLPTLSAYYAFAAPKDVESGTFNFGGSAFTKILDNGYSYYG